LHQTNFILIEVNQPNRLIDGHKMKCPRCKDFYSVEQYLRLEEIEEFDDETVPVYKCPKCKWIFALDVGVPPEILEELSQLVSEFRVRLEKRELA
jgi:phage FluMu protein Com